MTGFLIGAIVCCVSQTKPRIGRPPIEDPNLKSMKKVVFKARPIDMAALDAICEKRRLNWSTAIRIAIAHFVEFEGLRSEVEEKARLLISEAAV